MEGSRWVECFLKDTWTLRLTASSHLKNGWLVQLIGFGKETELSLFVVIELLASNGILADLLFDPRPCSKCPLETFPTRGGPDWILLMAEILHELIGSLFHYAQGFIQPATYFFIFLLATVPVANLHRMRPPRVFPEVIDSLSSRFAGSVLVVTIQMRLFPQKTHEATHGFETILS